MRRGYSRLGWSHHHSHVILIPCRQIILELRKEEDYIIPVWIILGSSLGGLMLLALLVLALWKVYVYTDTHTLHFCRKGI